MIRCPKCGSTNIAGPTYRPRGEFKPEALVYACRTCGYREDGPTVAQRRAQERAS